MSMLRLLGWLLCVLASNRASSQVVINEILYRPSKNAPVEFIELHNSGPSPADLSGWRFSAGVRFVFPENTSLPADGYLVLAGNTNVFRQEFGHNPFAAFEGRLSRRGETLTLEDRAGRVIDKVDARLGFPWPTPVGDPPRSIELVHPRLDNGLGGSWRSSRASRSPNQTVATPGARNSVFSETSPPQIRGVAHTPTQPRSGDTIRIRARISDPDGVGKVQLEYQVVEPGRYIELRDPAYHTAWRSLPMGAGTDTPASTASEFFVDLPEEIVRHRCLIRYRIRVQDAQGAEVLAPYPDDPQPNFACFVYDGVPPWKGPGAGGLRGLLSPRPGGEFATNVMRSLPSYHLISKRSSVEAAQWREQYRGREYKWTGTLVVDGKVYDHIRYRARGGSWRYAMGKNMWKFDFHTGHELQAADNWGRPYRERWSKLNLGACIQQADYGHRGEQGMFEAVGFALFNLAGVEAPLTHWVQLRVIDSPAEYTDAHHGDFWGLYLAVEQPDGQFLDEHKLPDGNFYKMEGGTGELNHHGLGQPTDRSDLTGFMRAYQRNPADEWWQRHLDLNRYYSYRSIVECIHHYDIGEGAGKNYFYYRHPQTGVWSVHPWDIDLTWADSMYGGGQEPFARRVLTRPAFHREYLNRLREIRDLLFNDDQTGQLIDQYAAVISNPGGQASIVEADRALWDHHPAMSDGRSMRGKSGPGLFYRASPTGDFAGMVQLMKRYVRHRSDWIDATLLRDSSIPATPAIAYRGRPGYPSDSLRFRASPFAGAAGFAAVQWRVGEVTDPKAAGFNSRAPRAYEITPVWQSDEIPRPEWEIAVPPGRVAPGRTYRARVRMKDAAGRWSHWSQPVQFIASE